MLRYIPTMVPYIFYIDFFKGYGNIVKRSRPVQGYNHSTTLAHNVEDFELVNQYMFITSNVTVS